MIINFDFIVVFRIAKRDECEMVMMIGLPGCGKTTWVNKYLEEHSDKKFDVLGLNTLTEKMKVCANEYTQTSVALLPFPSFPG